MQHLFNKKTFLGFAGLLLVLSMLINPVGVGKVDAEGGNSGYLPFVLKAAAPSVATMNTVFINSDATWKYLDKGTLPGSGWLLSSFNDSTWASGPAPIGYGMTGLRTTVSYGPNSSKKYPATFFRRVFSVTNPTAVTDLALDWQIDDGAVIFLNGKEVARINMPANTTAMETYASTCVEIQSPKRVTIDRSALVQGSNTLAMAVHQCSSNSSDLGMAVSLLAATSTTSTAPTAAPTATTQPTAVPTALPTIAPTLQPTLAPTTQPTAAPTAAPTTAPTAQPTLPSTSGRSFYVTTSGTSTGDGSASKPWSLTYALSQPSGLMPGDTIWVRGGTYKAGFTAHLKGTSTAPITVRAYPGERAILNYAGGPVLDVYDCAYVNFWGLEITATYSTRSTDRSESTYGIRTYQGAPSNHIKFINMIVHDVQAQGTGWWPAMTDTEIYGSLFYYDGTTQLDHGVYLSNNTGAKALVNNFIFDNAGHGIHGYVEGTGGKSLNNITYDGNTSFNNGSIGYTTTKSQYGLYKRNMLLGGNVVVQNAIITNNYSYYPGSTGIALNLGYTAGSNNSKVMNNYFGGGRVDLGGPQTNLTMTGNFGYLPGGLGFTSSSYPSNTWTSSKPSGTKIFVRPNKYEANRANITIYNWGKASSVAVPAANLGGIALQPGQQYELHNVQNYFGDVVTGTYDGSAIIVPMTNHSVAQPVGLSFKPASTFPEFGAFVLIGK